MNDPISFYLYLTGGLDGLSLTFAAISFYLRKKKKEKASKISRIIALLFFVLGSLTLLGAYILSKTT